MVVKMRIGFCVVCYWECSFFTFVAEATSAAMA
jgi:hypothetical protein